MKKVNVGFVHLLTDVNRFKQYAPIATDTSKEATFWRSMGSPPCIGDVDSYGAAATFPFWNTQEIWLSFDFQIFNSTIPELQLKFDANLPLLKFNITSFTQMSPYLAEKNSSDTVLYNPQKSCVLSTTEWNNIEVHYKLGENGRVDLWVNHKLIFSYRSPSAFKTVNSISSARLWYDNYHKHMLISHIIYSDERRIGYEKFKKLTIDPQDEQNIPQGGSVTYTLSGLEDSSEYSDITGVLAVLQPTSRDANISTGHFTLNGADVGDVDVSDSSGLDYVQAYSTTNNVTTKPWTRDDVEGKKLVLKVNGA